MAETDLPRLRMIGRAAIRKIAKGTVKTNRVKGQAKVKVQAKVQAKVSEVKGNVRIIKPIQGSARSYLTV